MEKEINNEINSNKKRIEVTYYQARFTQKCGAILLDFIVFVLLAIAIFIGVKAIVDNNSYYQKIDMKYDEARLASSLYVYNEEIDRVEDIVTFINRDEDMAASQKESFLVDHIYAFFDSVPEYKEELAEEYENFILNPDYKYNGYSYFIKNENGDIVKNDEYPIPITQYIENIYKPYVDNIALAEFLIKTPDVLDYQRYQSNMLLFLEIPSGIILSSIIVWYIIPLCFSRGKKSLGRLAFRIGLLGSDNLSLRVGKFTIRFVIFLFLEVILSAFTLCIPLIISLSMSAFSKKRQNFHDYMLGIREIDTYQSKIYKDKFELIKGESDTPVIDFSMKR